MTIITAIANIVLYRYNRVTPLYGVLVSPIFFPGWTATASFWVTCHDIEMQQGYYFACKLFVRSDISAVKLTFGKQTATNPTLEALTKGSAMT